MTALRERIRRFRTQFFQPHYIEDYHMIIGAFQGLVNRLDALPGLISAELSALPAQLAAAKAENDALKAAASTDATNQGETIAALDTRIKALEALTQPAPAPAGLDGSALPPPQLQTIAPATV